MLLLTVLAVLSLIQFVLIDRRAHYR
jgi:hypothetical protein